MAVRRAESGLERVGRVRKTPDASEARIQAVICQYLTLKRIVFTQTDGERSWNKSGSVRFKRRITRGWPDLTLVLKGGKACFIEVKSRKGRVRPEQEACHEAIREAGGIVAVVRSLDEVIAILAGLI